MNVIGNIAERKIDEALRRGELDDLPGMGRPLRLEDDDPFVPAGLRMAFKVLKNAGFVPPEVALRREIHSLNALLDCVDEAHERSRISQRLRVLMLRLSALHPERSAALDAYLCFRGDKSTR